MLYLPIFIWKCCNFSLFSRHIPFSTPCQPLIFNSVMITVFFRFQRDSIFVIIAESSSWLHNSLPSLTLDRKKRNCSCNSDQVWAGGARFCKYLLHVGLSYLLSWFLLALALVFCCYWRCIIAAALVSFNVKKKSSEVESGYEHLAAEANNDNLQRVCDPLRWARGCGFCFSIFSLRFCFSSWLQLFKLFSACFCGL